MIDIRVRFLRLLETPQGFSVQEMTAPDTWAVKAAGRDYATIEPYWRQQLIRNLSPRWATLVNRMQSTIIFRPQDFVESLELRDTDSLLHFLQMDYPELEEHLLSTSF